MTKSSNAFASQGLGSGREGKRNGEEESRRRQSAGWDRQAVSHVCVLTVHTVLSVSPGYDTHILYIDLISF